MWSWLKEFWKDCPWYALVAAGMVVWLTWGIRTTAKFAFVADILALPTGLYLAWRWKLLPNPNFHLALFLTGILMVLIDIRLSPLFLTWDSGYVRSGPEYPALIFVSAALAAAVLPAVPRLPLLRRRLSPAILSPPGRAAICLALLAAASYEGFLGLVLTVALVLRGGC